MTLEEFKKAVEKKAIEKEGEEYFKEAKARVKSYDDAIRSIYKQQKYMIKEHGGDFDVNHAVEDILYWF